MVAADAEAEADAEAHYGGHGYHGYRRYGWGHHGYGHHGHAKSYTHVHRPQPVQKCHTVYDTAVEKVCNTVYNAVCELVPTTQFRTEVDNVCHDVPEKVCVPTTQTIPDKQCATHVEQACTTEVHTVVDVVEQEQCQDIHHQVSYMIAYLIDILIYAYKQQKPNIYCMNRKIEGVPRNSSNSTC